MKFLKKRAWMAWLLVPVFFSSCATFNSSMEGYYDAVNDHEYNKAFNKLERNRFMKKDKNRLLFYLEAGRVMRLKGDYKQSNQYLNLADQYFESFKRSASDVILGNVLNPMKQAYRGEPFEQFMIHFYKALNYLELDQQDEAVVEARRISLATDARDDKTSDSKYAKDAFSQNVQGMIYEAAGDINNAFIAYRNAAETYLNAKGSYYGVVLPTQLKHDVVRTASTLGFYSEADKFKRLFGIEPTSFSGTNYGELVVFLEEGRAPVKRESNFILTSNGNGSNAFSFIDQNGNTSSLPFDYGMYGISKTRLSETRAMRIALPVYSVVYPHPLSTKVTVNGLEYVPQIAQDVNTVAVSTLKERFLKEMANALARQLTKKMLEKGTEAAAKGIAKSSEKEVDSNASKEEQEKKKKRDESNAKAAGEVAGFLMNAVNTITERADTRNWQSLPAFVSYIRIPLKDGGNVVTVTHNGKEKKLEVIATKRLQFTALYLD